MQKTNKNYLNYRIFAPTSHAIFKSLVDYKLIVRSDMFFLILYDTFFNDVNVSVVHTD